MIGNKPLSCTSVDTRNKTRISCFYTMRFLMQSRSDITFLVFKKHFFFLQTTTVLHEMEKKLCCSKQLANALNDVFLSKTFFVLLPLISSMRGPGGQHVSPTCANHLVSNHVHLLRPVRLYENRAGISD